MAGTDGRSAHGAGDSLAIELVPRNEGAELRLTGDVTLQTVSRLSERLTEVEASSPSVMVLDLRGVRFMDSTGLSELVVARRRSGRDGRRLVLVVAEGPVRRLLALSGLHGQFELVIEPPSAPAL